MITQKSVVILLVLCVVLFTGCQSANAPSLESKFSESTVSQTREDDLTTGTIANIDASSEREESVSVGSDTGFESVASVESDSSAHNTATSPSERLPDPPQTPVSQPVEPEKPSTPVGAEVPNLDPTKTPDPDIPSHTVSPEIPEVSESKISPEEALIPGKQYCDPENDPYGIVEIIRAYAESEERGFVLNEGLTIEDSAYRGHPNISDLAFEGVVETLKYHVDKIFKIQGSGYYNVVYRVYQGKLEYYFLVR